MRVIRTSEVSYPPFGLTGHPVIAESLLLLANNGRLLIFDISNPDLTEWQADFEVTVSEIKGLAASGNHAYAVDGLQRLYTIEIGDPRVPSVVGQSITPGYANDVAVEGSHAFVTGTFGLAIFDVADPTLPTLIASLALSGIGDEVAVSDNRVYATVSKGGLQVVEVSDPSHPIILGSSVPFDPATDIGVAGSVVYASGANLNIVDVSQPSSPDLLSSYPLSGDGIAVAGHHAFVAGVNLWAVDVANPAEPVVAGSAPGGYGVAVAAEYAYVNALWFEGIGILRIIDVANPSSPAAIGALDTPGLARDVVIDDEIAWIADSDAGLLAVDIAKPSHPQIIGRVDTENAIDVAVVGDRAYVADGPAGGLLVVNIENPVAPFLVGSVDTYGANAVAVAGSYAYVAGGVSGLTIVDVSTLKPAIVGNSSMVGDNFMDVAVAEDHAYVTDVQGYPTYGVVIDVSNPQSPERVGDFLFSTRHVAIEGDLLYVTNAFGTLAVFDITSAPALMQVAVVRLPSEGKIALGSNTVYVGASIHGGGGAFSVIDRTYPEPSYKGGAAWNLLTGVAAGTSAVCLTLGDAGLVIMALQCGASTGVQGPEVDVAPNPVADRLSVLPNPASGPVHLRLEQNLSGPIEFRFYDVSGRLVQHILHSRNQALAEVTWDGRDRHGRLAARGTYLVRASWPGGTASGRITLVR
jgi:hypothetical protein